MGIVSHVEIFFPGSTEVLQALLSVELMDVHYICQLPCQPALSQCSSTARVADDKLCAGV